LVIQKLSIGINVETFLTGLDSPGSQSTMMNTAKNFLKLLANSKELLYFHRLKR